MTEFQFLMLGFPTADAAERVVTTLRTHTDAFDTFHVTQVGPKTLWGSWRVKLLGTAPEPAEARPGALIAGILDAESLPSNEWRVVDWAPSRWQAPEYQVVESLAGLPGDLDSALIFRFDADKDADKLTSEVLNSVRSVGQAERTVVTSFALHQPDTVTMGSIRRELASVTGRPFELRFDEGSDMFEISAEPSTSRELVSARVERFIEGRCQERVKVGQPSWIAVQISAQRPKDGGSLPVDLPAAGTRVHAMLQTSSGLQLESEPDLELLVPPDRDTGWHAWQVRAMRAGTHQAVASFHHDGEVLAALGFVLRAGQSSGSDQQSASESIDLSPLALRQGLLVVRRAEGMLRFIGLDGAKQGEGITAVAQKEFKPKDLNLVGRQKKLLDLIARADRTGHSRAADSDDVRAMGIELFEFLPADIQDFLVSGLGRWHSLKIEADDESLPWELLAWRHKGAESFFANELPFLRWRLGLPQPVTSIACERAILVPGQELGRADTESPSFEHQIEALRERLQAPPEAVVRSTPELRRRIRAGDFDLLHYCGHMSADENGSPSMYVGNDSFNVSRISLLPANALARRPLVFLNACATNTRTQRLTGPAGWVEDFLTKGAGSFIGTNWTVRASTAAKFAEHFYDALLSSDRSNLAAASALARQQTAAEEGADWVSLAYTIYGHPEAKVQTTNHGDADVPSDDD